MAQEDVTILKIGTEEAVSSIADLKQNIKELKKELELVQLDSAEGWTQYQKTLKELQINQNALKDAMYATSGTLDDVITSANGASESYNSLVHKMAELKTEWRATNDEARRNELGEQIGDINQKLKDMDASIGNFQRNVGNYKSGFEGLAETLQNLPPTFGPVKNSMEDIGKTMDLVGKSPLLGIVGLLVPIIVKITSALQDNETAMGAVKQMTEALQPAMDFLNGILQKIAEAFAWVVDKLVTLAGGNGWFSKTISAVTGVGNAFWQYMLTPIRTIIEALNGLGLVLKDVFTGQWQDVKKHATEAWEGIKDSFSNGFSFQENFQTGQTWGEQIIEGIMSDANKKKAQEAADELKPSTNDGPIISEDEGEEEYDQFAALEAEEAQRAKDNAILSAMLEGMEAREAARQREADIEKAVEDSITEYIAEQTKKREELDELEKKKKKEKRLQDLKDTKETLLAAASATSQILNSIAEMYEQNSENDDKRQKKAKKLRIAAATIEMLQGAVTAYSSAQSLGVPLGPIIGGINAAAVLTMGAINISKMKATNTESDSGGAGGSSIPSASVSAPSIEASLQSVRNVTTASEEDRLNQMASSQKVYILQSDIEAAGKQSKVQIAESSF